MKRLRHGPSASSTPGDATDDDGELHPSRSVPPRSAGRCRHRAIAGYTICNDLSERDCQFARGGQWAKGKNFDTFAPLGPWLVTADEVPDPHALAI